MVRDILISLHIDYSAIKLSIRNLTREALVIHTTSQRQKNYSQPDVGETVPCMLTETSYTYTLE
jgi:predicted MarR family transcription regulator